MALKQPAYSTVSVSPSQSHKDFFNVDFVIPVLIFLTKIHGILQAKILEWVAFPFSRGSSQPRDRTQVSHIAGRFFTN